MKDRRLIIPFVPFKVNKFKRYQTLMHPILEYANHVWAPFSHQTWCDCDDSFSPSNGAKESTKTREKQLNQDSFFTKKVQNRRDSKKRAK